MIITVSVHSLKPYLVDFLKGHYFDYMTGPYLRASLKIYPGKLVAEALTRPPKDFKHFRNSNANTTIEFALNRYEHINIESNNYISPGAQNIIRKKIKAHFDRILFEYVDFSRRSGIEIKDAIDRFMEINKLNLDNITSGALIKSYYRYRKQELSDDFLKVKEPRKNENSYCHVF